MNHFEKEVNRNFRFNFAVNVADVGLYMFGLSFISNTTILPLYISHFTNSPIILGLIPFITTAGFLVPQLFSSNLIERAPIKKFYPFNLGLFLERIPVVLLIPTAVLFAVSNPILAMVSFFVIYTWYSGGAGFIMVGWQDMIAKIIPVNRRGRFFGISNFIGNITGIAGASVVSWVLANSTFPNGFIVAFTGAAICIMISWFFLGLSREPRDPVSKPIISNREYFRRLPQVVRSNPNFRNFLLTQMLSSFGMMASGFLTVFALSRWPISDGQAASYSIALLVGQSLANLALGFLADRKGHKIVLEISILFNVLSFLLAIISPAPVWFYAVFALRGVGLAGTFVSGMAFPLEFSQPQDRPTYIGLSGTLPGITAAIAPFLGGILASVVGYQPLFLISIALAIGTYYCLHWIVKDPRLSSQIAVQDSSLEIKETISKA